MTTSHNPPHSFEHLPRAIVEKNWKTRLFWLIPLGAAVLAGYFVYNEAIKGGPRLHSVFSDAQGLQAGNSDVKYRGARVGTVKAITLNKDRRSVDVTVALDGSAADIAREGTRFWIVKAQIGVTQITAPRTIVSGDFITFEPGEGRPQTRFVGLGEPPVIEAPGTLRIMLIAERQGSLKQRSPVFYRGEQVGQVFSCQLGDDAQTIKILADIDPKYAPLVRPNSKFWNAGGVHVSIGLSGAEISAQSAEALVSGGVDFATPDTSQGPAQPGTAFRLYDKPEEAWLTWSPRIRLKQPSEAKQPEFSQSNR